MYPMHLEPDPACGLQAIARPPEIGRCRAPCRFHLIEVMLMRAAGGSVKRAGNRNPITPVPRHRSVASWQSQPTRPATKLASVLGRKGNPVTANAESIEANAHFVKLTEKAIADHTE